MTKKPERIDVKSLASKIQEANQAYYSGGHPIMTDQEYDTLKEALKKHDPSNSLLSQVGSKASDAWKKTKHQMPMGSLNNVFTEEDFQKWSSRFPSDTKYTAQPKLDGLSLSIIYKNSHLVAGITRGDGQEGEEITSNVFRMRNVPKTINSYNGSVRAEILLSKKDFQEINDSLPEEERYSNARNAASGISRRLDGRYCDRLMILPYDHLYANPQEFGINVEDEDVKIDVLNHFGFKTPVQIVGNVEKMIEAYNEFKKRRDSYPFGIDGVVIKVCSGELQKQHGVVGNCPRAQIAWKFTPPGALTKLIEVTWDVGRTGILTPLAWVEPVEIEGSTIKKATLHNAAEIERLGIGIGDTITLVKAGDIIPKVTQVVEHVNKPIQYPTKCPACNSPLKRTGPSIFCTNDLCPRRNFHRIMNWIKVVGIDEFGQALAEKLIEKERIKIIADIYKLESADIINLEGWGSKSAKTIIDNIQKASVLKPSIFLTALGIPGISEKTSEELLSHFGTIDRLMEATVDEIVVIRGFSTVSARSIVDGLAYYKAEIDSLLMAVTLKEKEKSQDVLTGLSFCFTGAMEFPRECYQDLVKKYGGTNSSSVTKTLSFLVCNENKGSTKSRKAAQYGTKIIPEKEFLAMIGESGPKKIEENFEIKDIPLFEEK